MSDYKLYWIRYPEHTDPFTEGYIGISNNIKRRWGQHKSGNIRTTNTIVSRAINKGATIEVLLNDLTEDLALFTETFFRPVKFIGWNILEGGGKPPSQTGCKGRKPTEEARQKMRDAKLGKKMSEETKEKIRLGHEGNHLSQETKDKIRMSKIGVKQKRATCPHCGKVGGAATMKQAHFDRCKTTS